MEILSPAWATDLAMLRLAGSEIEAHPTFVVVRTPELPTWRWGNFVLLRRVPLRRDLGHAVELFHRELPGFGHVALGFDDPEGDAGSLSGLAHAKFSTTADLVLVAQGLLPHAPTSNARVERIESDDAWAHKVALDLACDGGDGSQVHETLATRRAGVQRRVSEAGNAAWFGAWEGNRMLASTGVVRTDDGRARLRRAAIHPEARGRGLGALLVEAAAAHAAAEYAADTLVTVCDPHDAITRLYRRLGFTLAGHQLQAERTAPLGTPRVSSPATR
ncbi:GNAT family N-acetyltransferase [Nocardioides sp. GY 10127]|uniref:GNAT family N-acetyltransferase n=1 Tax=Nocardioides sp. GY 10127 TaxID=2569762 RepID=UPI001458FAAD|nr:GNAT family N-acetyltransferase [Nocardioides sp. GY 10127]